MTIEEANSIMDKYRSIVMKQPISKDMKTHIIEGFGIDDPADKNYTVYVIGQDVAHAVSFVTKPLEQWLSENEYR
jgi:hypothetical protein